MIIFKKTTNMKNKIKYSLGAITFACLCYYSAIHPEKYHILITIVMGVMFIISIAALIADKKESHNN